MKTTGHTTTPIQQEILSAIRRLTLQKGVPPTVREIGDAVGLRSSCSVQKHLDRLQQMGQILRSPYKYRSIEIVEDSTRAPLNKNMVPVPLVGQVAAGTPIDAVQNIEEYFPLPESLVPRDTECFMLRVQGDSMINAGIFDRDLVVVRKQATARPGEIVVARIGDEATVKTYYTAGENGIRLQPENPHLRPIITREAQIEGKVILTIRQY